MHRITAFIDPHLDKHTTATTQADIVANAINAGVIQVNTGRHSLTLTFLESTEDTAQLLGAITRHPHIERVNVEEI